MTIYQFKNKLSASSYTLMGVVGVLLALIIIPTYILSNGNQLSDIKDKVIIIDSIMIQPCEQERLISHLDIWSDGERYWSLEERRINNKILSTTNKGDTLAIKYAKKNNLISIIHNGIHIYEYKDTFWLDITQFILMGAVFGFIAYWGAKTMRK